MNKLGIIALMALVMAGLAYASCTFGVPGSSGTLSGGTSKINASCTDNDPDNCTVTASSATSGDTIAAFVMENVSIAVGEINYSLDTTGERDAADWVFSGSCMNSSGNTLTLTSITAVTIDNTNPLCVFAQEAGKSYPPTQTFTVTCTNSTSAGTIRFGNNIAKTMSKSSTSASTCTYTGNEQSVPEGVYDVVATTSDGTDTTSCTISNVRIDIDSTLKQIGIIAAASAAGAKGAKAGDNSKLALLVIIAGAGLWYMNRKK